MSAIERVIFSAPPELEAIGARLIFGNPFSSSLAATILHHHLASVVTTCPAFDITLGPLVLESDGSAWLPVLEGGADCRRVRDQLFTGPLSAFTASAGDPRVDLGTPRPEDLERLRGDAPTTVRIETLTVVGTDRRGRSETEAEVDLAA